jgi:gamma-carbonic anhydrase
VTETASSYHPLITLDEGTPVIAALAYVARDAVVAGRVEVLDQANIWYQCVLRGDYESIRVGARSNLQDRVVVHTREGCPVDIGSDVTVGHGALLHGCTLQDRCLIGMGAIVLDAAVIETGAIVAAGAVVPPGKRLAGSHVWGGNPARVLRPTRDADFEAIANSALEYVELSVRHARRGGLLPLSSRS